MQNGKQPEALYHQARSFAPVSTINSRVLILGSMPGIKSLEAGQYYAHERNLFWPVMGWLFNADVETFAQRIALIKLNNLALWDVLECCHREGSLDTKIIDSTIAVNDFTGFLSSHPRIGHIFFNGAKAEKEFMKRVRPHLPEKFAHIKYHRLPSTSPAMAVMKLEEKAEAWKVIKEALNTIAV